MLILGIAALVAGSPAPSVSSVLPGSGAAEVSLTPPKAHDSGAAIKPNGQSAPAPRPGKLRAFGDWIAGCDNLAECNATSLLPLGDDEEDEVLSLVVTRPPGGGLVIQANERQFGSGAEVVEVAILGVALGEHAELDTEQTEQFFGQHSRGEPIILVGSDRTLLGHVSSKGLEEAVSYIDEVQRRSGQDSFETPVIRSGYRPNAQKLPVGASWIRKKYSLSCDAIDRNATAKILRRSSRWTIVTR
ncbi:MAG: DUF1176 domain-containing protein [Sphingosinicella sp.]|nr:DUF1176 domain-containing protein [Sphingosinicella sp.]